MTSIMTSRLFAALKKNGNWMLRTSNDGVGYGGFIWAPIGEWTTAPDWDDSPDCNHGGLFGQGPGGFGFAKSGTRFELCETRGQRVAVDDNKIKVPEARILCVDRDALEWLAKFGEFGGSLNLRGYSHPLPEKLSSVGGYLNLDGYSHPLPEKLSSVWGDLYLNGYSHPLPAGLRHMETRARFLKTK